MLGRKKELQERLAELDAGLAEHEGIEVGLEEVRGMLRDFDTVWEHLTLDEQREMLRALIDDLSIRKDRAGLKLHLMPAVEIGLAFKRGPTKSAAGPS